MLTDLEKRIVAAIQGDIPVTAKPYHDIAGDLNISEDELLEILQRLCDRGVIRRYGATLRHQKSGFSANAMVAWRVDEDRVHQAGELFASFKEVSHCYRRNPTENWPYNLYTMVHAPDESACRDTTSRMARAAGIEDFTLLFSKKELKKTSMQYFK